MKWTVCYYDSNIAKAIEVLPISIRKKLVYIIESLEEFGPQNMGMPHVKPMGNGIFEIRAKGQEGIARAMYCLLKSKQIMILHVFIKKTQEIPLKDLMITKKRLRVLQNEEKTYV